MNLQKRLQPVPDRAKFIDSDYYIWGGSMVRDDGGTCHLYYSRWPREYGFSAWVTHSEIAHAVADDPLGPFKHVDVALPRRGAERWDGMCTHNPTAHRFDGKYYIYHMGNTGDDDTTVKGLNFVHRNNQRVGVAVADSPYGPWIRFDDPIVDVSPDDDAPDSLCTTNPSLCRGPDGTFLLIYKAVGKEHPLPFGGPVVHLAATSDSPTGPFRKHPGLIFAAEGVMFPAEDPYIWHDGHCYRAIVKDQKGYFTNHGRSLALFESENGVDWQKSEHALVSETQVRWEQTGLQKLHALERPQLYCEDGQPRVLYCAVNEEAVPTFSYNVHIPLG